MSARRRCSHCLGIDPPLQHRYPSCSILIPALLLLRLSGLQQAQSITDLYNAEGSLMFYRSTGSHRAQQAENNNFIYTTAFIAHWQALAPVNTKCNVSQCNGSCVFLIRVWLLGRDTFASFKTISIYGLASDVQDRCVSGFSGQNVKRKLVAMKAYKECCSVAQSSSSSRK